MNKYLMMMSAAAAVLAGTDGASGITLDNGCNLNLIQNGRGIYSVQYGNCGSAISYGQGLARKTRQGKFVDLSDNYSDGSGIAMSIDISLPLKNVGTWALWVGLSGTTSFVANSGTYTVGAAAKTGGNLMAETKALIARLKAARAQR